MKILNALYAKLDALQKQIDAIKTWSAWTGYEMAILPKFENEKILINNKIIQTCNIAFKQYGEKFEIALLEIITHGLEQVEKNGRV